MLVKFMRRRGLKRGGMFQKIVTAVDGSPNSLRALDKALQLAKQFSSELVVVSVVHIPITSYSYDVLGSLEVFNKLEEDGKQSLAKCVSMAAEAGVAARTVLLSGDPAQGILDTAAKEGADLLIVGSRGTGTLERLLMGSVSERVVRFSKCPVLVVK
jgi:nucleotide-binding universal stress UspA family protein